MRGITKMTMANRMSQNDPENRRDNIGQYAPKYGMQDHAYRMGGDDGWIVKPLEDAFNNENGIESRFRDRRGREHYNNGRYAPMRSYYDEFPTSKYETAEMRDGVFQVYDGLPTYRQDDRGNRMIGFAETANQMRTASTRPPVDELQEYRSRVNSDYSNTSSNPMSRQKAKEWISSLQNSDGSTGEHWTYEQTNQAMKQRGISCDPNEFYAAMNMLWSDYGSVAKKYGVDSVEFWVELTKSFLYDKDAHGNKLKLYYECIVKK